MYVHTLKTEFRNVFIPIILLFYRQSDSALTTFSLVTMLTIAKFLFLITTLMPYYSHHTSKLQNCEQYKLLIPSCMYLYIVFFFWGGGGMGRGKQRRGSG